MGNKPPSDPREPLGHVLIAIPIAPPSEGRGGVAAGAAIDSETGFGDLPASSPPDGVPIAQAIHFAKAQRELARLGYHSLVVQVDQAQTRQLVQHAKTKDNVQRLCRARVLIEEVDEASEHLLRCPTRPRRGVGG